ncbi:Hypothetical predicted protein [Lecanosticta acicola]|uniref:Uncharacterized protein n=1 Tax=Lecanosticta acicola TaxID=111012 RepID=A0AAI8YVE4_9PEZI|nr:Hypothetical predicted protein [Lecanosticta acicola]
MAGFVGFALNAAGVVGPMALTAGLDKADRQSDVNVVIILGTGGGPKVSTSGNIPHVAVWDDDGNRIGQYHPGKNQKFGKMDSTTIGINAYQNGGASTDPYYVMVSNLDNDAICVASIAVSNEKISSTFFGDTGKMCGQSWFLSENKIGDNFYKPACVWLDADHTNKINARALSFHLNDMAPDPDKINEYNQRPETLCQSTPRFSFWGNMLPDGIPPFFKPKLEYLVDADNANGEGADKFPDRVIDKPHQYNKAVYIQQGEKAARAARNLRRSANATMSANHNPEHLIITHHTEDNVREVCEHKNSYGWDIVSTVQNLYCDMETKQLYQLCNGKDLKEDCFDMNSKTIVPKCGVNARDEVGSNIPVKAYTSEAHWQA